jgi:uncharacterized protein (DUF885 family)
MKTLHASLLTCAALMMTTVPVSSEADAGARFRALADQYFSDVMFRFAPTSATLAGFHEYDPKLENYSRAGVDAEIAALKEFEWKFDDFREAGLDESTKADLAIMRSQVRSNLLELETIRSWQKNPDSYSSGISNSAFALMERDFAPADERLRSLIAREKQMPAVFTEARANLENPPRIYTEIALEQLPDIIDFFRHDVPEAFQTAKDPATVAEFQKTNAAVIAALESYEQWLKTDLLPRSKGDFRIGADTFRKKLLYDDMVDTPLDRLLQIGYDDLHRNQEEFKRVAKEIDPNKTPKEVLAELASLHPAPDQLMQSFHNTFDSLIGFINAKKIITIPSTVQPTLEETPPFMRATTQASMDTPGPYEKHSTTAYFNVTLPEKSWPAARTGEYMAAFNRGTIISTSVHEAYPGHYVQFLWVNHGNLSAVRKMTGSNTNIEGWAHYCEQMMLDEGYNQPGVGAKDERESRLIRLGQLQDALLRDARFVVGIRMHTQGMSLEQAQDFFVNEGYQSRPIAEVETKRGTADPTYLYYTLGKLEIMKLRSDLQSKEGTSFSLEKFHDAFMRQGGAPIKIVRKALLGDDSPTL